MAFRLALLLPVVGASRTARSNEGLCTKEVVKENCAKFKKGNNVAGGLWVRVPQLARSMGIPERTALSFLEEVGVRQDNGRVSCQALCEKSVGRLPKESLPPRAQVGCAAEADGKLSCDVDLSAAAMSAMGMRMQMAENKAARRGNGFWNDVVQQPASPETGVASVVSTADDLAESVANWFEIYQVEMKQTNLTATQKQAISVAKSTLSKALQYTSNANDVKAYGGSQATSSDAAAGLRSAQAALNNFVWLATTKAGVQGFITCRGSVCCMRNGKNEINVHVNVVVLEKMVHVLLHEALHCSPFNSKDVQYVWSDTAARNFAKTNPAGAKNNTSSWTFYSQRALR